MRKTLWIGLVVCVSLVLLGLVGAWMYLSRSLPPTQGTVALRGLDGPVEIVRDADGVSHIHATTDHDAFLALGYVHAQERLWQMELQRRLAAGRLSEILGPASLRRDKFYRTLGMAEAAQAAWHP